MQEINQSGASAARLGFPVIGSAPLRLNLAPALCPAPPLELGGAHVRHEVRVGCSPWWGCWVVGSLSATCILQSFEIF
jgi:hypothetical protein